MPLPLRIVVGVVAAIALVVLLFTVVFPWFDRQFVTDPVLGLALVVPVPLDPDQPPPGRAT